MIFPAHGAALWDLYTHTLDDAMYPPFGASQVVSDSLQFDPSRSPQEKLLLLFLEGLVFYPARTDETYFVFSSPQVEGIRLSIDIFLTGFHSSCGVVFTDNFGFVSSVGCPETHGSSFQKVSPRPNI